jgi:hypothetical protein
VYPACDNAFWTPQYADTMGTMMGCYPTRRDQPGNEQAKFGTTTEEMSVNNGVVVLGVCNSINNHQTSWGKREYLVDTSEAARTNGVFQSTVCSVFIPLYHLSSVLQYFDKATTQLQWELQLFLHNNQNINIETNDTGAIIPAKLELVNNGIELWARRITPTETARLILTEKMNRGLDMSIKWADLQIYKNTVDTGIMTGLEPTWTPEGTNLPFDLRVTVTANRPVSAVVLFQYTEGDMGTLNSQEWAYDRFDTGYLSRLQMLVNNVQIPTEGMDMANIYSEDNADPLSYPHIRDQVQSDVARPFYEYLRYTGNYKAPYLTGFSAGAGTLSLEDWRNRCPAYCFDLSAREIGQWAGGSSEIRLRGNVQVPPRWDSAPAPPAVLHPSQRYNTITAWVLLYTERTLGIHLQNWNSYVGVA